MPKFGDYDDMADGDLVDTDTTLVKTASGTKEVAMSVVKTYTGGGGGVVVWPSSGVQWVDGVAPTMTDGIEVTDLFRFVCIDGTDWVGTVVAQRLSAVAPPQVVQYKVGGAISGTVDTATIVMDPTPVQGNMLVAFIHSVTTRECTPASGSWTEQYDTANTDGTSLQCFTHTVGVSETNSYVFNWDDTAEYNSVIVVEVSGAGSVDEALSSVTGNAASPSGTNTSHPNLVFLHAGTDGGLAAGAVLNFDSRWTTLYRHFPTYHANAVAYFYAYGTAWPSAGTVYPNAVNIPRGLLSLAV